MNKIFNTAIREISLEGREGCSVDRLKTLISRYEKNSNDIIDYLTKYLKDHKEILYEKETFFASEKLFHRFLLGESSKEYLNSDMSINILEEVAKARNHGITQMELSKLLKIDPRSMFHFIKKLVERKLVLKRSVIENSSHTFVIVHFLFIEEYFEQSGNKLTTEEIRIEICKSLKEALNQTLAIFDLRCKLRIQKDQLKSFKGSYAFLAEKGYVERINVPNERTNGLIACLKFIKLYKGEDDLVEATTLVERSLVPKVLIDLSLNHQVYNMIKVGGNYGVISTELQDNLNNMFGKTLDMILSDFIKSKIVTKVSESIGRERRYRYKLVSPPSPSSPLSTLCPSQPAHKSIQGISTEMDRMSAFIDVMNNENGVLDMSTALQETISLKLNRLKDTDNQLYIIDKKTILRIAVSLEKHGKIFIHNLNLSRINGKAVSKILFIRSDLTLNSKQVQDCIQKIRFNIINIPAIQTPSYRVENIKIDRLKTNSSLPGGNHLDGVESYYKCITEFGYIRYRMQRVKLLHKWLYLYFGSDIIISTPNLFSKLPIDLYFKIIGQNRNVESLRPYIGSQLCIDELPKEVSEEIYYKGPSRFRKSLQYILEILCSLNLTRRANEDDCELDGLSSVGYIVIRDMSYMDVNDGVMRNIVLRSEENLEEFWKQLELNSMRQKDHLGKFEFLKNPAHWSALAKRIRIPIIKDRPSKESVFVQMLTKRKKEFQTISKNDFIDLTADPEEKSKKRKNALCQDFKKVSKKRIRRNWSRQDDELLFLAYIVCKSRQERLQLLPVFWKKIQSEFFPEYTNETCRRRLVFLIRSAGILNAQKEYLLKEYPKIYKQAIENMKLEDQYELKSLEAFNIKGEVQLLREFVASLKLKSNIQYKDFPDSPEELLEKYHVVEKGSNKEWSEEISNQPSQALKMVKKFSEPMNIPKRRDDSLPYTCALSELIKSVIMTAHRTSQVEKGHELLSKYSDIDIMFEKMLISGAIIKQKNGQGVTFGSKFLDMYNYACCDILSDVFRDISSISFDVDPSTMFLILNFISFGVLTIEVVPPSLCDQEWEARVIKDRSGEALLPMTIVPLQNIILKNNTELDLVYSHVGKEEEDMLFKVLECGPDGFFTLEKSALDIIHRLLDKRKVFVVGFESLRYVHFNFFSQFNMLDVKLDEDYFVASGNRFSRIQTIPMPWIDVHGKFHPKVFQKFINSVCLKIMEKPGITRNSLLDNFAFSLNGSEIDYLLHHGIIAGALWCDTVKVENINIWSLFGQQQWSEVHCYSVFPDWFLKVKL